MRLLKRAESLKQNRKKFKRNSENFISQPFAFAKKVLTPEIKGKLTDTKEEVEKHLRDTYCDKEKEEDLPIPDDLYNYPEVKIKFDERAPSWREFNKLLRKARTKSAPGPNGVPYRLYKKCPGVARLLWLYLRGLWRKEIISKTWRRAEGVFIPKENGATTAEKFRTISLLNVEGKLQMGLLAGKMTAFVLGNDYIDTSIQKGGIPGVSGCLEHTAILSQLIQEAKQNKKNLVVTWLDIANAYGSIPHKLMEIALQRAHIPNGVRKLIASYYNEISIRFTTKQFTTDFLKIEKGIITGCTLSVILFALTITMLVLSIKKETKGPKTESGQQQKNTRLFMDDITTTTETMVQTNHLLQRLSEKLEWARLKVKPKKCRCLVIHHGVISKRTASISGEPITSLTEEPIKYLGKEYNLSLSDQNQTNAIISMAKNGLKKINNAKLPGRYKSWILQHMLLPKIMWPLTIYNIPASKVEVIQKLFTASLRRWLGLPKSMSSDALYSTSMKLQLPYSSVVEEVKAAKSRTLVTFQQSKDECINKANIKIEAGKKWRIENEVEEAKSKLRLQEIAGIANIGREGLGLKHRQYYSTSSDKEKRGMIVEAVREKEEETRRFRIMGLSKQGASTKWEVLERKIGLREVINTSDLKLRFLIKSVYDLLPTPANKNVWFNTQDFKCELCEGSGTLNHILSGCKVALQQGRYKWRHDKVLREIAHWVEEKRKMNNNNPKKKKKDIQFVKSGATGRAAKQAPAENSYLITSRDWRMEVDLDKKLKIPPHIMETNLRPDMMLISEQTKQLGLIELTVPSEDRIELSSELKKGKYAPIEEAGERRGWKTRIWAVEVGCRGFPAASLSAFLREIGYSGKRKKTILRNIGQEAEKASYNIWSWSRWKEWGANK